MIGAFVRLTGESGQVGYLICISMGAGGRTGCVFRSRLSHLQCLVLFCPSYPRSGFVHVKLLADPIAMARSLFTVIGTGFLLLSLLPGVIGLEVVTPEGFTKRLFEENFSRLPAGSQPSPERWSYSTGTSYPGGPHNWGTGEIQHYTNSTSNVAITSAGTLRITPLKNGDKWTSSRIESTAAHDFACPAGGKLRIEASIKLGNDPVSRQMGIWPAFWTMGSEFRGQYDKWPAVGEIDVLEGANGEPVAYQALHCGWAPGGPCNEFTGLTGNANFTRGEFHQVAVEIDRTNAGGDWKGETLSWLIDGVRVKRLVGRTFRDEWVWTNVTRSPKFVLLNVAVGGAFPDNVLNPAKVRTPVDQTVGGEGSSMEVEYVAVFST